MSRAIIELDNVTFRYPDAARPVLEGVSLTIQDGEFILVAGRSGTGKSTLLRLLNGLVPHFTGGHVSGRVQVAGHDPIASGPHGMSAVVGFVQQDPEAQFVVDTVEDELAFGMENQGLAQPLMRKRVEEVLDQLAIAHLRHRRVTSLSSGEKQRVAIGSALTLQPKVLVLDEPTSQLDPQSAEEVFTALRHLNQDLGLTIVCSEHRLERVVQYADRMLYLPQAGGKPLFDTAQAVLPQMPFAPPIVKLARALHWQPIPLTIKEARGHVAEMHICAHPYVVNRPGTPPCLVAEDVWYDYGEGAALAGVSVQASPCELIALMGRNGSGKSTLLKHLVGLLRPRRGRVTINGLDTRSTPLGAITAHVGYVPQEPGALLFSDTVRQELEFTRRVRGLPAANVDRWLTLLGLQHLSERYPRDLSVGERQRVAVAAILVAEPRILLLDEPTRGLDPEEKVALARSLRTLADSGHTIILATHDVELAAECVQRVIILGEGQVVVDGPAREVMTQSLVFASQVNKLYRDPNLVTVQDVLEAERSP